LTTSNRQWQLDVLNTFGVAIGIFALLLSFGIQNRASQMAAEIAQAINSEALVILPASQFDDEQPTWTFQDFAFLDQLSGEHTWAFESWVQTEVNGISSVVVSPSFFQVRNLDLRFEKGLSKASAVVLGADLAASLDGNRLLSLRENVFEITDSMQAISAARVADSSYANLAFLSTDAFPYTPGARIWLNPKPSELSQIKYELNTKLAELRQKGLRFKVLSLADYYLLTVRVGIPESIKQATTRLGLLLAALAIINLGISGYLRVRLRSHEFALRRALGSPLRNILWLAAKPFFASSLAGIALAIPVALLIFTRYPSLFAWGIQGLTPVCTVILLALSCMLPPLWQSSKVQPAQTLKGFSFQQAYRVTDSFAGLALAAFFAIITVMVVDLRSSLAKAELLLGGNNPAVFYLRGPQHAEQRALGFKNPSLADYQALATTLSEEAEVGYLVGMWIEANAMETGTVLFATASNNLLSVVDMEVGKGRYFNADELGKPLQLDLFSQEPREPINAVIGSNVAQAYLTATKGIGTTLNITANFSITVIGVLNNPEMVAYEAFLANAILLPLDLENPAFSSLLDDSATASEIIVRSHSKKVTALAERTTQLIGARWEGLQPALIRPGESLEATLQFFRQQRAWFVPLIVAAILLAGTTLAFSGLISVNDRLRYLGLLRAVGASKRHLLRGELGRLLSHTIASAGFGVLLAYLYVIAIVSRERFMLVVDAWMLISALVFVVLISALFGWMPLRQALRLAPQAALRREE
jgi:ABC-type antimicrobial peptide transport system permease subunit